MIDIRCGTNNIIFPSKVVNRVYTQGRREKSEGRREMNIVSQYHSILSSA